MSNNNAKQLVEVRAGNDTQTTYIKLNALTPEQAQSGIYRQLAIGDSVVGNIVRTFTDKFDKVNYVIKGANGAESAIAACGNLTGKLAKLSTGTYVEIVYDGKNKMTSGKYAGKEAHGFTVLSEKV